MAARRSWSAWRCSEGGGGDTIAFSSGADIGQELDECAQSQSSSGQVEKVCDDRGSGVSENLESIREAALSVFDSSGSTFYDKTGESARENAAIDSSNQAPHSATPPPYSADEGRNETFEPISRVADPSFQPEHVEPVPPTLSLPLIAAGLFVLWIIFRGDK